MAHYERVLSTCLYFRRLFAVNCKIVFVSTNSACILHKLSSRTLYFLLQPSTSLVDLAWPDIEASRRDSYFGVSFMLLLKNEYSLPHKNNAAVRDGRPSECSAVSYARSSALLYARGRTLRRARGAEARVGRKSTVRGCDCQGTWTSTLPDKEDRAYDDDHSYRDDDKLKLTTTQVRRIMRSVNIITRSTMHTVRVGVRSRAARSSTHTYICASNAAYVGGRGE